jgi:uncharacterized protein DUF433
MLARVTGLEPATSGVTGRRSNQLSYTRIGRPQRLFWPAMPVKGVWLEILRLMGISCGEGAGRHDFARKEAEPSRNDRLQSRDHERGADDSRHAYCGGTRIAVEMILVHLRAGYSRVDMFNHYPTLHCPTPAPRWHRGGCCVG